MNFRWYDHNDTERISERSILTKRQPVILELLLTASMSSPNSLHRVSIRQFADQFRNDMIPLSSRFCYFSAAAGLSPEDLHEYLEEPVAALPPGIASLLPPIRVLLVPYLERANAKAASRDLLVTLEKPTQTKASWAGTAMLSDDAILAFAVKDQEVADYHYRFYRALAELVVDRISPDLKTAYNTLLRDELSASAHGEMDEGSWRLKQNLVRRGSLRRESKLFDEYARASFVDTLTLYLHGICCDIDVETGPRQLATRWLRRRLRLFRDAFAPPSGYAVFPEEVRSVNP